MAKDDAFAMKGRVIKLEDFLDNGERFEAKVLACENRMINLVPEKSCLQPEIPSLLGNETARGCTTLFSYFQISSASG